MRDQECVDFLQWALPGMGMRWEGFRRVRRQVCRRVSARITELGLSDLDTYREYLTARPDEWKELALRCRVTISRFYRDRGVFDLLSEKVLPLLAQQVETEEGVMHAWSAGCAGGEEPYTLGLIWRLQIDVHHPDIHLDVLATDADRTLLERAERGVYGSSSLRQLPAGWREQAFDELEGEDGPHWRLREGFREGIRFEQQDLTERMPEGSYHLILCRNLVFTYYDRERQRSLLESMLLRLPAGGLLVLGAHEGLPGEDWPLQRLSPAVPVYRKALSC